MTKTRGLMAVNLALGLLALSGGVWDMTAAQVGPMGGNVLILACAFLSVSLAPRAFLH